MPVALVFSKILSFPMTSGLPNSPPWPRRGGAKRRGGSECLPLRRKDYSTEAFRLYRKAAEQGFANAQHNVGLMYAKGDGIQKNDAEAARWYRTAAEQGLAIAQLNLDVAPIVQAILGRI
jgi:TPR repeat protein